MIPKLQPCLWFDGNAEEAARFYAETFPDSRIDAIHRAPSDYPAGKQGNVLTVEVTVLGMRFLLLNGGPQFTFDEAVSFQVATDDQAETDRYWKAIVDNGGQESACGWCRDRFGLSWQITPRRLTELITQGGETSRRAFEAMMEMGKIDIAALDRAVADVRS
ncbi:VOC family protein [Lysobacter stagni]|uniref:VOC family protein n=1 Tax=Lysobacter stagni TaxID=3045172 RepID=UPI003D76D5D3